MTRLRSLRNPEAVEGMARYGINPGQNLGVSVTMLRRIGKEIGKDHDLALELWGTGIRDARLLATLVAEQGKVTRELAEKWGKDFDSWDVCDGCCNALLGKTDFAYQQALEWSHREEEFVKRAGFALMATLAVQDKKASDVTFEPFLEAIIRESDDDRNYVKKAVNWALRSIGKRNLALNRRVVDAAREIDSTGTRSARWIAKDALRKLTGETVIERLRKKEEKEKERRCTEEKAGS